MSEEIQLNHEVTAVLDGLNHPFRNEIEQLRIYILSANTGLGENLKWNGPNYSFDNEDRITMRIQPPKKEVRLVFHRGAKKQPQPKQKLISNKSEMLVWKDNSRAVITFKGLPEIEKGQQMLADIVNEWLEASR
ncbi:DUF1801 domain-containing protein [Pedobacter sp. Leaf194]|uniref:DUF1801 domain-containing protein n=1 Tax=Pedobacter sp. Leaf194 TaxID=1736297 RepID=UPI0007028499|nr:DUF1801 domain-containing protein [Pedobacter sp. Leaf194]KQS35649.1 hypothetical protein ASG14_09230 [Pedobacter sp. Leaf194]